MKTEELNKGMASMIFKPATRINFGSLSGHPLVGFKLRGSLVYPAPIQKKLMKDDGEWSIPPEIQPITQYELFRRWKIARKAWRSRKWKHQLALPL